jgi:hypothetical protein
MPRLPKPYKTLLEWSEEYDRSDDEWPTLNFCTQHNGHQYHLVIRMRDKWWGQKERFCSIDIFVDEGLTEDQPNIIFGHFFSNLRKIDPYRYKDMALKWAEEMIVSPMTRLTSALDSTTRDTKDQKATSTDDSSEILTNGKKD